MDNRTRQVDLRAMSGRQVDDAILSLNGIKNDVKKKNKK